MSSDTSSVVVAQTSFQGETSGGVTKRCFLRLLSSVFLATGHQYIKKYQSRYLL